MIRYIIEKWIKRVSLLFSGELGGLMGLLLGASVLSIFEIFDLFIYNSFRKCFKARDDKVNPTQVAWN